MAQKSEWTLLDGFGLSDYRLDTTLCVLVCSVLTAHSAELLHVNLAYYQLLFQRESFRLGYELSFLIYIGVSSVNQVLRALAESARAVNVA